MKRLLTNYIEFFARVFHHDIEKSRSQSSYWDELNSQCQKGVLPAAIISLFAFLRYIPIDRELHPELPELVWIRLGLSASGLLTIILYLIPRLRREGILLWLIPAVYVELGTAWITAAVGSEPSYVTSYVLVLMLFVIVPFPIVISYGLIFSSGILYLVTDSIYHPGIDPTYNTVTSQSVTTLRNAFVIVLVFIFFMDRVRRGSYLKSKKIESQRMHTEKLLQNIDKEILLARKIQTSLLPQTLPSSKAIDFSYHYSPVTNLGGDFIDINYLNGDQIGIFICDVSGHGVPAAFLASMVKMSLNTWTENISKPADVLLHIHDSLKGKLTGHFLTASLCYVDLKSGLLRLASAGHLPMILVRNKSSLEVHQAKGRVICDLFPPDCVEIEIQLNPGDKFLLYTDGIIEARNANLKMFDEVTLTELIQANMNRSPKALCDLIIHELKEHLGPDTEIQDDVTLIVAEFKGF
jgi:hypothetical protein